MSELVYAEKEMVQEQFYPMIPIYDVHVDPNDAENILAIPIETNYFPLLMETGPNYFEIRPVEYDIFRQDQMLREEIEEETKKLLDIENHVEFDPEVTANANSQEEEMTSLRANELYRIIMQEWDEIVLGKKTGDFEQELKLEKAQSDYFDGTSAIIYDRAWEVHDIIMTLIEGKYQPRSLFGNFDEIYQKIGMLTGRDCARELVKLARLMSRCVSPETVERQEDIVESTIPATALMKNA